MEKSIELLKKELQDIDVSAIASDMIRIPSYSFMENQEEEMAKYIDEMFKNEGIESTVIEIAPGRYNLVACIHGKYGGKSLMLSGHMDTVPAYDMSEPFAGTVRDGILYGRGACDMKGPLAAMIAAVIAVKRSGIQLKGDLYFTGLSDEEERGIGVEYLVKNGPVADATIMGEPTDMDIALGHKGLEWIRVNVHGHKVHGGDTNTGINAIEMAARFINRVYEKYTPVLNKRAYPLLGRPTVNVGKIIGGDQPSTVAGTCEIQLDRRCVPTETIKQVYDELDEICRDLHKMDKTFNATIEDMFNKELMPHIPFLTEINESIVTCAGSACEKSGKNIVTRAFTAWTDAGIISNNSCSKCIIMGPGSLSVAHSPEENINIEKIKTAAEIYGTTAILFCNE